MNKKLGRHNRQLQPSDFDEMQTLLASHQKPFVHIRSTPPKVRVVPPIYEQPIYPPKKVIEDDSNTLPPEVCVVKWFNNSRNYGFLVDEKGADLFIHGSTLSKTGTSTLITGQRLLIQRGQNKAKNNWAAEIILEFLD